MRTPFATNLESFGSAPALVTERGTLISYGELAGLADEFARGLTGSVRLLAIAASNELACVAAYLGALRAGVPVVLFAGEAARGGVLRNSPPDAIYEPGGKGTWRLALDPKPWAQPPHPDLALLLSTSGSTGSARLVRLSGANLQANAASIAEYLGLGPGERAITSLPLSYSYGLSVLNSHLTAGASVVLTNAGVSEPEFRRLAEAHSVTSLAGVPYSYELMDRSGLLASLPPSVRTLTQAGGRMAPELIARANDVVRGQGARLFIMYGQTEATARIAFLPPDQLATHIGAIGGPIPRGELWIEDELGGRAPPGSEGELVYRGANVMMGYATSREDLAPPAGSDTLHTGDIAVEEAPGVFRITGRKSRFVKPYGLRVGLDEIEQGLCAAGVEAFVTGDDHLIVVAAASDEGPTLWRVLRDLPLPPDLFEHLALDQPPRLPGGKPDYVEVLRRGRAQRAASREDRGGMAEVEALFRRLSHGHAVGDHVSFEALGGDSLSYVQCSLAVEQALGDLPADWERLPLSELRVRSRAKRARGSGVQWTTVEGSIVVRCLAILQILAQHAFNGLQGGADVLMVLAGFSWARFQRRRLLDGDSGGAARDFAARYLVIYAAIIAGVSLLNQQVFWSHAAFVSTFRGDWGGILNTYWFIESLTWCVGLLCVAAAIPGVRRWAEARPRLSALAFVAVGVAARAIGQSLLDAHGHVFRSPDQMLLYFAAGWAMAFSGRLMKLALFALLIAASGLVWTFTDTHVAVLAVAAALVVGFPRISFPSPIARAVTLVASASFYIYLFNPLPMYLTDELLHAHFGGFWWLQIGLSLAGGIGLYFATEGLARVNWRGRFGPHAKASASA